MFSGPLAVIKVRGKTSKIFVCISNVKRNFVRSQEVIETKSTKSLPFPMAVATVVNCSLWASFGGLVIHDPFIWAPNILGLASGLTQLGLFAKYGFAKEEPKVEEAKVEEIKEKAE